MSNKFELDICLPLSELYEQNEVRDLPKSLTFLERALKLETDPQRQIHIKERIDYIKNLIKIESRGL